MFVTDQDPPKEAIGQRWYWRGPGCRLVSTLQRKGGSAAAAHGTPAVVPQVVSVCGAEGARGNCQFLGSWMPDCVHACPGPEFQPGMCCAEYDLCDKLIKAYTLGQQRKEN